MTTNDLPVAEFAAHVQQTSRRKKTVRRSTTPWALIVGGVLVGVLALGGAAAWLNRSAPPEVTSADRPATSVAHDSKSSPPTNIEHEPKPARLPAEPVASKVAGADPQIKKVPPAAALEFDGQSQYARLGNPPELNFAGQITISAWVKLQNVDGLRNIVVHGYSGAPPAEVFLRMFDRKYSVGSWNGEPHAAAANIPPEDLGTWVQLTGVYDGTQWKLFRNGQLLATAQHVVGAIPVNESWAIAASGGGKDRYFQGGVADVRIYRRGLSDNEVQELFSRSASDRPNNKERPVDENRPGDQDRLSEGLVGNWALDAAADPVVDRSAGGHNGKLVGRPRSIAGPHAKPDRPTQPARAVPPVAALEFDGQTQYVALGNPPELNFAGQITLAAWIKPADITSAGYQEIIGHDFSVSPTAAVYLRMFHGQYQVGSWNGTVDYSATSPVPASDHNQWVQLTGVYDGTRWKLFRNGLLLAGED